MKKPPWLSKKIKFTEELHEVKKLLGGLNLHTVCESAKCPNLSECFTNRRATFLILGDLCTRSCRFCAVKKGKSVFIPAPDKSEPERVASAVKALSLRYVVITSVTRDDLPDGGSGQFVKVIKVLRELEGNIRIEVLTPDFGGNLKSIDSVVMAGPDVYNHNVETVPRLYRSVRPEADYNRSISLLKRVKNQFPSMLVKSGLMVGLGESREEIYKVLNDIKDSGCDAVTIGQYLSPGKGCLPVIEYIPPSIFDDYRKMAEDIGFKYVASAPYVRSSYMAHLGYENLIKNC